MNYLITGGLGFVGRNLCRHFLDAGHQVTATGRSKNPSLIDHPAFNYISADTAKTGKWQEMVKDQDVVINLAGKNIFTRWTEKSKRTIYDSRILTTRNLVEAISENQPITLLSTSAVGYYGDGKDALLREDSPPGDDFLASLSVDWEQEALKAESKGARVALTRFGIVLGKNGGALSKMIPAFRFFLGGPLGSGNQWFPWIHMQDLVQAFAFVIDRPDITGALNFCSPHPVRNRKLASVLGDVLNRPAKIRVPAVIITAVMGEFGKALLASQQVVPQRLEKFGFDFTYPDLKDALTEIIQR